MQTYEQWADRNNVTMIPRRIQKRSDGFMSDMPNHWRCSFHQRGVRVWQTAFSQGPGHTEAPTIADVLDSLASDFAGVNNARGFVDWAEEYGYDPDSRAASKIYDAIEKQRRDFTRALAGGKDAIESLMYRTERL